MEVVSYWLTAEALPCEPCPTCTDGIQNQGEAGIDCGGPCPIPCPPEKPFLEKTEIKFTLYAILIVLGVIAITRLIRVLKSHSKLSKISGKHIKVLFFFVLLIFFLSVATAQCFPEYKCGDWSECVNGFQTRICKDQICNNRDLIERTTCVALAETTNVETNSEWTFVEETNQTECSPIIQCNPWSSCAYMENTINILKGKINYGGYRERVCEDLSKCIPIFVERSPCEESFPITTEKTYENDKEFLVIFDSISESPVAKINLNSWRENKLDIMLTQKKLGKPSSCFNGVKDNNEENIDCGGKCKPCKTPKKVFPLQKMIIISWILAFAFILAFLIQTFPIEAIYFKLRQLNFNTKKTK